MMNRSSSSRSSQGTKVEAISSKSSKTKLTEDPDYLKELVKDAVYELKRTSGDEEPAVEVIFFHGLQPGDYTDAYRKTWLSDNKDKSKSLWPRDWLGERLSKARILSISYGSAALKSKKGGKLDADKIAENLIINIVLDGCSAAGQKCPVVLVGHSLGAIAIKNFILIMIGKIASLRDGDQARKKMEEFLRNCKGVFYYSSPQDSSNLATYLQQSAPTPDVNRPIIELLTVLGRETARINADFSKIRRLHGITTAAIFESFETEVCGGSAMLVPEASNRIDLDRIPYSAAADHFNVCKPKNDKNDNMFIILVDFIETVTKSQEQTSAKKEQLNTSEQTVRQSYRERAEHLKDSSTVDDISEKLRDHSVR